MTSRYNESLDDDMLVVSNKTLPGFVSSLSDDEMKVHNAQDDHRCLPRLGPSYLATIPPLIREIKDFDAMEEEMAGELVWNPEKAKNVDIESFLSARYIDKPTALSEDQTPWNLSSLEDVFHLLHNVGYDTKEALDQMDLDSTWWTIGMPLDRWSLSDIELFEAGFEYLAELRLKSQAEHPRGIHLVRHKVNKFEFIRRKYLPHKTIAEIVSYYYHSKLDPCYSPQQKCQLVDILEPREYDNFAMFDQTDLALPSEQLYNSWELDTALYGVNDALSLGSTRLKRSLDDFEDNSCDGNRGKRRRLLDQCEEQTFIPPVGNDSDASFWGLLVDV